MSVKRAAPSGDKAAFEVASLRDNREETADLSTTLRSGRDDKFMKPLTACVSWRNRRLPYNKFVISTGAQRSGEICGFFPVITQTRNFKGGFIP